jgi:hypothetical protein
MLSQPINLSLIEATQIIDTLYDVFCEDFVRNRTLLAGQIYIDPRSNRKSDGKELDFWHLTTKENKEKIWINNKPVWQSTGRFIDFPRASRLAWVKQILSNYQHPSIKVFYHQESNEKKNIRLYFWAYQDDFVVILQKLGSSSSFLVTSFYIEHDGKRKDYEVRYKHFINNLSDFANLKWF